MLGSDPNATQLNATLYNPIPEPEVKMRVMTRVEMAITRLAATAFPNVQDFQVAF